ncbi:FAD-dependent oxidoreductase, partial [Bosea sp. CS1GBMeth4]|uniref:NAD(P)/FAD-dependent oxidoreductase n=1 Tax=Bosea sp. CS1GBMeth4 TaxID=1892849 RepID=UPI00164714CF
MRAIATIHDLAERYDLVVVGAGPAGLSAAARAAELGLDVLLVDENPAPGGQIYRCVTTTPVADRTVLGAEYWRGADIVARFEGSQAAYAARCTLWSIGPDEAMPAGEAFELGLSLDGRARLIGARQLILATGAQERPFPIAGWTLPGVMTAGAAQIALKSAAIVPAGRTVIAGCGPLLYLLAGQLAAAGAEIVAVLDTTPRRNWLKAAPALPDFLGSPYLLKGLKLIAKVRRSLRVVGGVTGIAAEGAGRIASVRFERGERAGTIACDTLLLHQGVIPSVNLANAAGCAHDFDEAQHAFVPRVDEWLASSVPGIAIAGDGAGIGGAESAALRGEIAALGAAGRLGRIDGGARDRLGAPIR